MPSGWPQSETASTPQRASAPVSSSSRLVANAPGADGAAVGADPVSCAPTLSPRTTSASRTLSALARCHAASRASSDATDGSRDAAMCGTGTSPGFSRRSSVSAFSIASGGSCGSAGR